MPTPNMSEALEAIRIVNHFYEATAGNSKIVSQIMSTEGHLKKSILGKPQKTDENHGLLNTDVRLRVPTGCYCLYNTVCMSNEFSYCKPVHKFTIIVE
jgi:hypothetical protein